MAATLKDAFDAAERNKNAGGRRPVPSNVPAGMAIDNTRPVNSLKWTGGSMPPEAPGWSTSPGAAQQPPGRSLALSGPGLTERQPTRVPPNASMGTAPRAAPMTPNLPATIPGQGPTFQGNGARTNFTTPGASSPYNAQQAKFDADTVQRARDAARARAAGGTNAGVNQGSSAGVQGRAAGSVGGNGAAGVGTTTAQGQVNGAGGSSPGSPTAGRSVREGLRAQQGALGKTAYLAGRAAPLLAKGAGAAGTVANFNDYKLDDPDVDSSASGTVSALRQGDFAGAGRSLSKGLLETGMDLGSYAANTADIFVPGQPFSQGYNKTLRNHFGDQLIDGSGNNSDTATQPAPAPTTTPAPTRPANRMGQGFDGPRRVDLDPSRQSLGAPRDFTNELANVPAKLPTDLRQGVIHKTMDANGRPVYSGMNVGPNAQFVDGVGRGLRAGGEVNTVPGMSKEAINRTLTNPDGSKWSAQDNAMMAANLRDGVDPYRGMAQGGQRGGQILPNTSRDPREGQDEQKFRSEMAAIAARRDIPASTARALMRDVTDRRNNTADNSTRRDNNAADNATREKGDQLQAETSRYQADGPVRAKKAEIELAQAQRQRMADIVKAAGGDMALAQEIAVANGLDGSAFGAVADKQSDRASKSRERVKEYLAGPSSVRNKDGELEINPALQAQNADLLRNVAPGVEGMSGPQQAEVMRDAIPALNLINGANDLRNNSFWGMMPRFLGGTEAPPAITSMPKFKSPLAEVGTWEGMTTFGGVGAGDYKATTVDGKTMYYPREKVGERELALLRQQGAPLGK